MTGNPLDTRETERNIAVWAKVLRELEGARASIMQTGFYGELSLTIPVQNGSAERGRLEVRQHTPI